VGFSVKRLGFEARGGLIVQGSWFVVFGIRFQGMRSAKISRWQIPVANSVVITRSSL